MSGAEELEARVNKIAGYYLQGFVATVGGIHGWVGYFVRSNDATSLSKAMECYEKIEGYYKQIPFEDLQCDEDLAPLFVIRRMLPRLKKQLEDITKYIEQDLGHAKTLADAAQRSCTGMAMVAETYRDGLNDALEELRKQPGYENYCAQVRTRDGVVYRLGGRP